MFEQLGQERMVTIEELRFSHTYKMMALSNEAGKEVGLLKN